jgi:TM2 domain-containing membrane protein YozV
MSTEQSQIPENNSAVTPDDVPPPAPSAPAVEETPPPAPAPAPAAAAPVASNSNAKDKKLLAGILGIVLGAYGVHKFILGYQKEGIIMAVTGVVGLFLCGIPTIVTAIIGLIEGIMYLTKSDEEFDRIYIQGKKPWF